MRLINLVMALIMAVTMTAVIPDMNIYTVSAASNQNVKRISFYAYPAMRSIKIKWKKKDGVKFYRVYRVDLKRNQYRTPKMYAYRKVGQVSGSRSSWTDKKVKKNHYYGYVLRGYKRSKSGKAVLIYDSYMDGDCDYACANLDIPEIFNGGNGENYANSKNKLYIYVQRNSGVRPDGVVIYRKTANGSKYKKIKVRKADSGRFDQGAAYVDSSVTPGKTYCYKAKTYKKYKGKRRYSSYSSSFKIPAVNFKGLYSVETLTEPGYVNDFTVKLTSEEYNGVLNLKSITGDGSPVYSTDALSSSQDDQMVTISGYSHDNVTWEDVPESGVDIKAGENCYLKFKFNDGTGYFAGNAGTYSTVFIDNGARYDGSAGWGSTFVTIDFLSGKATAFCDYDN